MPSDRSKSTEKTSKGLEVPIPKRDEFFANLKKVAKASSKAVKKAPGSR
jgi:hypothetical protein